MGRASLAWRPWFVAVVACGAVACRADIGDRGAAGGYNGGGSFGSGGIPGFTQTTGDFTPSPAQKGGWKLGPQAVADAGTGILDTPSCSTILGVVRDFKREHPDFESFTGLSPTLNLVKRTLGTDKKPVYNADATTILPKTSGKFYFDQWYRNTTVNVPYYLYLYLVPDGNVFTFQSDGFFPLDWAGWGNEGRSRNHNFDFTTEVHTEFTYKGNETFRFSGDDDLWVFINWTLAIDLGGPHSATAQEVTLDDAAAAAFQLVRGKVYPLDLFHAERHEDESNFQVETNIQFVRCGIIVDKPPG
ncbi:MAG TPA: fibro-slime domain-containing protein [Polyangiaceae bacterium]